MTKTNGACIIDRIPRDMEHMVHVYLPIGEVCALRSVSKAWSSRVGAALREEFQWDVRPADRPGDLTAELLLLEQLAIAHVNIRSIDLVRERV